MSSDKVISFNNGRYGANTEHPKLKVKAARDCSDGDWKTSLSKHDQQSVKCGQIGMAVKIFDNLYGTWCRVSFDNVMLDINPSDLDVIEWW